MNHFLVLILSAAVTLAPFAQEANELAGAEETHASLTDSTTADEQRNKALAMRFYEEAWHNDNYAVADEIFAPDYIRHDASDPVQGPSEAVLQSERTREVKRILPDLRFEYDVIMTDGNMVAVRWTSRGHPAGVPAFMRRLVGKSGPVVATGVNIYRFREGRVVELWNNRDDLTIQQEMGIFRWYGVGGFVAGVLITLLGGWVIRRFQPFKSKPHETATP